MPSTAATTGRELRDAGTANKAGEGARAAGHPSEADVWCDAYGAREDLADGRTRVEPPNPSTFCSRSGDVAGREDQQEEDEASVLARGRFFLLLLLLHGDEVL